MFAFMEMTEAYIVHRTGNLTVLDPLRDDLLTAGLGAREADEVARYLCARADERPPRAGVETRFMVEIGRPPHLQPHPTPGDRVVQVRQWIYPPERQET